MSEEKRKPNHLIQEKSPYLLQHAYNPVDWYPWGEEAFEKARRENKPVFLSIGYSTCHWCHVMARESFEDGKIAGLINEVFVPVKVDREERPDIDNTYMTVCQVLLGRGGWPLNIFITPDKKPFFAGTYIPKKSRLGQTGMEELVPRIKEIWENQQEEVLDSAEKITETIRNMVLESSGEALDESVFQKAYAELLNDFDGEYGGFEKAPKFPAPHKLSFLLRYWRRSRDSSPEALHMLEHTLEHMQRGGLYDHLGSGFHRYSTDKMWFVPHFEKMLYDQALLAAAYTEAFQATGKAAYRETAEGVLSYVLRDMTSPEGGFYCGEDADVEGEEGRYYLWTLEEIRSLLDPEDIEPVAKIFNLKEEGNFEDEIRGRKTGANILHMPLPPEQFAAELGLSPAELEERLRRAKAKLFEARQERKRPLKDDKILTDWNGLMIAAFAKGFRVFGKGEYLQAANKAADFILSSLYSPEKRLLHRYRDRVSGITAKADDYAFFIHGLLELYEAGFELRYLKAALALNRELIEHFWDPAYGGLFFTADDSETLIFRRKELMDAAVPSANSLELLNLLRLARVTGDSELEDLAGSVVTAFSKQVLRMPSGYTQFLVGLDFGIGPTYEVVIAGKRNAADTKAMLEELRTSFIPNKVLILRPDDVESEEYEETDESEEYKKSKESEEYKKSKEYEEYERKRGEAGITELAPYTKAMVSIEGKATAYVCKGHECRLPTTEIEKMLKLLDL
ncbi:MAG: thioredoxin domain-containing protein [Methanosarcinaceae archaeon]|nr:thioredoxin domain-containing protein [Methanosarcinaceae archaeon]